ncbi:MAG TPA: TadE family protein [Luteimonas sp.]
MHRSRTRVATRRPQRGQALTEMAIVAAVMVPLFLLVPMLGKYFHVQQTAQQAARSAAWQATVVADYDWNALDANQQRGLVIDRHFGLADDPIRTAASGLGNDAEVASHMMNTFSGRALLRRGDIVLSDYRNDDPGGLSGIVDDFLGAVEHLPIGEFPPNQGGLVTSELVVRPRNLVNGNGGPARFLDPFDTIDLEMRASHVLLADAWNAAGNGLEGHASHGRDRSVMRQVESLAPASLLGDAGDVLEDLEFLELLPVLGVVSRARPGYIQPDIVPRDKLERYQGP